MNQALGSSAVKRYRPLLANESLLLLKRILADPQDYMGYIRRYAGGLTLQSIYGYRAEANDDPMLELGQECVSILSNEIASGGGIWPVDVFPFREWRQSVPLRPCTQANERVLIPSPATASLVPWRRLQAEGDSMEGKDGGVCRPAVRARQGADGERAARLGRRRANLDGDSATARRFPVLSRRFSTTFGTTRARSTRNVTLTSGGQPTPCSRPAWTRCVAPTSSRGTRACSRRLQTITVVQHFILAMITHPEIGRAHV